MHYTVQINEYQRQLIAAALRGVREVPDPTVPNVDGETKAEELAMLRAMIDDMPKVEADAPGDVHGLCQ